MSQYVTTLSLEQPTLNYLSATNLSGSVGEPVLFDEVTFGIDLGPEGGKNGGTIVFEGTPEDLAKCEQSFTGKSIAEKVLKKEKA